VFGVIRHIIKKELLQTFRDNRMRVIVFIAPIIQLTVFGFAATFDVKDIKLAVSDLDRSVESRELIDRFEKSAYFNRVIDVRTEDETDYVIDKGIADLQMTIPTGFGEKLSEGKPVKVQFLVDGTNSNSATIMSNYVEIITSIANLELIAERQTRLAIAAGESAMLSAGSVSIIVPEVRVWYNEELEAKNFMVPAVFAMVLMVITVMLTAIGLTREREIGTYEQLIVSPLTPEELIIGKTVPFALVGLVDVTFILIAAWLIFGVTVKGSLLLFYLSTLVFLITTLSLGIFISSISQTMQQALMSAFFFMFPFIILSGMMFPINNMPEPFQWLTLLNPLRYYIEIVRGLFLKGIGLEYIAPRVIVLLLEGMTLLAISSARFSKRLQ
jgi:drug efflux transport system permease protein